MIKRSNTNKNETMHLKNLLLPQEKIKFFKKLEKK